MEQQTTTPKFENPRHKVLNELAKAHDERVAAELTPVEGMPAVEFEPAPKEEPITAQASAPPAEADKAAEIPAAGSSVTEPPARGEDGISRALQR